MFVMITKQAFQSLLAAPVRSLLTILGVIIGISSVVMFMALGEGLRHDINQEITGLGSNLLVVVPGQFQKSQQLSANLISGDILKQEDVDALARLPAVQKITPMMLVGGVLRHADTSAPTAILLGTNASFPEIFSTISIGSGRFFSADEASSKAHVIVLGESVAKTLFDGTDVVGKTVTINKDTLTIVGVTKAPEQASVIGGADYGSMSMLPIQTAGDLTGGVKIVRILMKIDPNLNVKQQVAPVKQILLERHNADDFSVLTQDDILGILDSVLKLLTAAIIAIAAISLVVAGVGIMNIMLVAVTERTREIGLRKAIGASNGSILIQFLIEAIILTLLGAVIALVLVFVAVHIINQVAPIHPLITLGAVGLAVGVSVTVGLIFGLAPALRAARLDPITALRYE